MKRFHVHVAVDDLAASIRFYSTVFGQDPNVEKPDYAKWMLEDPRVNFAISHQDHSKAGLNHLGVQVETGDELAALREQLLVADAGLVSEENTACCYVRSDKHWVTDPSGIAWESFHTLSTIPVFGDHTDLSSVATAECCTPEMKASPESCCIPLQREAGTSNAKCCG
ncbi:MAG: glyoxalase/bleomycin resistance/dioxygenase family protein [Gammaproteobacteria bacterium]|nr:glyoxalase/bleomycin resistance/dioxygenase family protein [Gammaproteobacteria bacterium]